MVNGSLSESLKVSAALVLDMSKSDKASRTQPMTVALSSWSGLVSSVDSSSISSSIAFSGFVMVATIADAMT